MLNIINNFAFIQIIYYYINYLYIIIWLVTYINNILLYGKNQCILYGSFTIWLTLKKVTFLIILKKKKKID